MKKNLMYGRILPVLLCIFLCGCAAEDIPDDVTKEPTVSGTESESTDAAVQTPQSESSEENSSEEEKPPESEEEAFFLSEEAYEYARMNLNETEQIWYCEIRQHLGSYGRETKLDRKGLKAGLEEKDVDRIFQCVLNDHPELFFVEGYSYTKFTRGDETISIQFSGTYSIDEETAMQRKTEIEAAAAEILQGIGENADEYTKVKYVYDTVIHRTDYDISSPDNQNIYSVLVNRRSVCQGYAKAAQYLLNRLGVECTLVLGTVETGEGHAWNLVKVDGSFYYLDATWGDASYRMDDSGGQGQYAMPEINYDYLNVTTDELLKTHTIGNCVPMPACVSLEANYYYREGALFTSYDREQMQALFDRAREQGRGDVTIKCSNEECYNQVTDTLIRGQEIFTFLDSRGGSIAYAQNDKQMSLTFWVTNE